MMPNRARLRERVDGPGYAPAPPGLAWRGAATPGRAPHRIAPPPAGYAPVSQATDSVSLLNRFLNQTFFAIYL